MYSSKQADRPELGILSFSSFCTIPSNVYCSTDEQDSSFAAILARLPPKPPGTIRLFYRSNDSGGFYSTHHDDALYIARVVYNTSSVIKYLGSRRSNNGGNSNSTGGNAGVPSCTLSKVNALNFLREALTVRQLKIEIWSGGGKKGEWALDKQVSYYSLLFLFLNYAS